MKFLIPASKFRQDEEVDEEAPELQDNVSKQNYSS